MPPDPLTCLGSDSCGMPMSLRLPILRLRGDSVEEADRARLFAVKEGSKSIALAELIAMNKSSSFSSSP